MQNLAKIENSLYEEMRKHPFFFVKLHAEKSYDNRGKQEVHYKWVSVNHKDKIEFPVDNFGNRNLDYCLCKVDRAEFVSDKEGQMNKNEVTMYFHDVVPSEEDLSAILYDCVSRSMNQEDKYSFVTLIWVLDKCSISQQTLVSVLRKIPNAQSRSYVLNLLRQHGRCLSRNKQKVLTGVCEEFDVRYDIYMPAMLVEALDFYRENEIDIENSNLFSLVDFVMSNKPLVDSSGEKTNNPLIKLRKWFMTDESFDDYSILQSLFSLVSESVRLLIVKRYFHDVRLGNTRFDCELIKQFIDNKYDSFIRYRYSINTPNDDVVLTVPLLCDTILTLYNTKGKEFQSFNGILDFAITHCDSSHPAVDWKLDKILPTCNHGVIINNSFKGFIDYQYICKINQSRLDNMEDLEVVIKSFLDSYFARLKYPVCKYGDGSMLDLELSKQCLKKHGETGWQLSCVDLKLYPDKWVVDKYVPCLKVFIKKEYFETLRTSLNFGKGAVISWDMISVENFRQYVMYLVSQYTCLGNGDFLVPSYKQKTFEIKVLEEFWDIKKVRIMPRQKIKVDKYLDIFGFWKEVSQTLSEAELGNEHSSGYMAAEEKYGQLVSDEISKRCVESLKSILGTNEFNGEYFEIPYQKNVLIDIVNKFYFKDAFSDKGQTYSDDFLVRRSLNTKYVPLCAPKQNDENFFAINLPYFWCRGNECFHNNLRNQSLASMVNWYQYSLYHLAEIIGYPKLHLKEAGYEPDDAMRTFIAIANRVLQKFRRLKCRGCGHLMFANKSRGFNRYNYFSCVNPFCSEHGKSIYLNFCFKCKKGLIDSRDTKQCPNNWYICPDCLSCCDDNMYARQVQLYILAGKPVPEKLNAMLGKGHNDKNIFFCPNCGSQILITKDEHNSEIKMCPHCQKRF